MESPSMLYLIPAAISFVGSIVSAAVVVTSTKTITREHERRLNENDAEHGKFEDRINTIDTGFANLRGQLGMNGGK